MKKEAAAVVAKAINDGAARKRLVEETMKAFGKLTIFVNNAGGCCPQPFDMPLEKFAWPTR